MTGQPILYVFAGPNGAGKTTFARSYLPREAHCLQFLNADYLAHGLSPLAPELAAVEAGKLLLRHADMLMGRHESFALETTLSGITLARRFRQAQDLGYWIKLYYLWLPSAEISKARVRIRVQKGGHHIPDADIERRIGRSLENFKNLYRPIADEWHLFDATPFPAKIVASGSARETTVFDEAGYNSIIPS